MQGTMHASSLLRTPAALKHSSMFTGQPVVSRSVTGLCHISRRTSTYQHFRQNRRASLVVEARYRGSSPDIAERVLAAVPYLLPFLDSFSYGRFLFYQYPIITKFIAPMGPLISLYTSVPFAPLLAFFGVYLGIVQNMQWSRFVRFNAMQVSCSVRMAFASHSAFTGALQGSSWCAAAA